MRVLEVRTNHQDEDIKMAQMAITSEINRPSTNVMILRGDSAEIAQFADNADARSEPFPYRQVIWAKSDLILTDVQKNDWFGSHDGACAVIFDFNDIPVTWLSADATLYDIEDAFLSAQGGDQHG
jgi:hypothetical protein